MERAGERWDGVLVMGVALAARLVFVWGVWPAVSSGFETSDGYDAIAASLVAGHGFVLPGSSAAGAERLPLYPMLLAAGLFVAGGAAWPWQLGQAILGALSCWLVLALARRHASRPGALAAALLCALHPTLILYTARPLTETLAVFVTLAFVQAVVAPAGPRPVAGLWLGLGLLVKSSALLHLLGLLPALVRGRGRRVGVILGLAGIVLAPWAVRNVVVLGAPHVLTATAGRNLHHGLYISRHVGWMTPAGDLNSRADWALWTDMVRRGVPWTGDVIEDDRAAGRLALRWMAEHPGETLGLWARNLLLTWYLGLSRASMVVHAVLHLGLLAGAVAGVGRLWREGPAARSWAAVPALLLLGYTATHALIKPGVRYIVPVVPLAAVLSAAAWPIERSGRAAGPVSRPPAAR